MDPGKLKSQLSSNDGISISYDDVDQLVDGSSSFVLRFRWYSGIGSFEIRQNNMGPI